MAKAKAEFVSLASKIIAVNEAGKLVGQNVSPDSLPEGVTAYQFTWGGYDNRPPGLWIQVGWCNKAGDKSGFKRLPAWPANHAAVIHNVSGKVLAACLAASKAKKTG